MPAKPWTTERERKWLEERIPQFIKAQENNNTASIFFPEICAAFKAEFTYGLPTPEEVANCNGDHEKAHAVHEKKGRERILQWFHNHTRVTSGHGKVIKIAKAPKLLPTIQAYTLLYNEKKLKNIVDIKYKEYLDKASEGEKLKPRLAFLTEVAQEEYANETQEVKDEVEEYRQNHRTASEKNGTINNQYGIDSLLKTLDAFAGTLSSHTGWSFTILCGGPTPRLGGEISSIMYHHGKTAAKEEDFEQFLGEKNWNDTVFRQWGRFLQEVYPPKLQKINTSSKSKASTKSPKPDEGDVEPEQPEVMVSAPKRKKSDYELTRAKNIAENQALLAEIKKDMVAKLGQDLFESGKKDTRRGNKKAKAALKPAGGSKKSSSRISAAPALDQQDLDDSSNNSKELGTVVPAGDAANNSLDAAPITATSTTSPVPATSPAVATSTPIIDPSPAISPSATGDRSGLNDEATMKPAGEITLLGSEPPLYQPDSMQVDDVSGHTLAIATSAADEPSVDAVKPSPARISPESAPDATSGNLNQAETGPGFSFSADMDTTPDSLGESGNIPDMDPTKHDAMELGVAITGQSAETDTSDPKILVDETLNPHDKDLKRPNEDQGSNKSDFVISAEAYLRTASDSASWVALVDKWLDFERDFPTTGSLIKKNRPAEVMWWFRRGRLFSKVPPISKVGDYAMSWRNWWTELQPAWRQADANWPPSRTVPDGNIWSSLGNAGRDGFFLVIITLSWWSHAVKADGQRKEFDVAVEDTLWVLNQVMLDMPRLRKKRALEDSSVQRPRSKRQVTSP